MRIKNFIIIVFTIVFSCAGCFPDREAGGDPASRLESPEASLVKLVPVVFGGNRYVVEADFGLARKVPLMVHGNAGFYLMLTHEIAEQLNGGSPVAKIRDFGYSDKGMGRIDVEEFRIGDRTFTGTENVRVFDWPAEEGKAAQGMLGIDFLKNEKCRIDFAREEMEIGVAADGEPDKVLLDKGYSFVEFFVEKSEGYLNVYFDALAREIPVTVGTVSSGCTLDAVTFRDRIELESAGSRGHSPSGTTPQVYLNKAPVSFRIAGQAFEIPCGEARLYSFAEYENVSQAELFPFGILGRDWMKENNAVIDYANNFLYFRRSGGK